MLPKHPTLFCKPTDLQNILFNQYFSEIKATIGFRSLQLENDLPVIHKWVHEKYAHEYWQMNGHYSQLYAIYQCMELNPYCHSFVGSLPLNPPQTSPGLKATPSRGGQGDLHLSGGIICQFDVYSVFADELRHHVDAEAHDCGFHLLMAPNESPIRGLTVCVVKAFLSYYFSFSEAKRMYAEPDVNNHKSISLLERCGFRRIKTAELSYKTAFVYVIDRATFLSG